MKNSTKEALLDPSTWAALLPVVILLVLVSTCSSCSCTGGSGWLDFDCHQIIGEAGHESGISRFLDNLIHWIQELFS
jgi:hypothetical protein